MRDTLNATTHTTSNMADDATGSGRNGPEVNQEGGVPTPGDSNVEDPYVREVMNQLSKHQMGASVGRQQNNSTVAGINDIATWQDPQLCFKTVDNFACSSKHFDITDFVSSNMGGATIGHESLLSDASGGQLIFKTGPVKPKLESITLCDWSLANLSILYKLLESGEISSSTQADYLSYTKRIYQLVKCYEMTSVFFYDREYRCLQNQHKFRWGTDVPHLQTIFLRPRAHQQKPQPQRGTSANNGIGKQLVFASHSVSGKQICKKFNSRLGCHIPNCRFEHICGVPGCGLAHPAQNHSSLAIGPPKN